MKNEALIENFEQVSREISRREQKIIWAVKQIQNELPAEINDLLLVSVDEILNEKDKSLSMRAYV